MDQSKKKDFTKDSHSGQFQYLGRWCDKDNFRAFVYDRKGNPKLAGSYTEFQSLTESGVWFASKEDASNKERKQKDVTLSNSK